MITASISVEVRKALIDGLSAHLSTHDAFNGTDRREDAVLVSYGYGFGATSAQQIYLGRTQVDTPPAALRAGRNVRDEKGRLELTLEVKVPGGSVLDAEKRLLELFSECESWLADRKGNQLGVPGLQSLTLRSWNSDYRGIDSGAAALLTAQIEWTARLT